MGITGGTNLDAANTAFQTAVNNIFSNTTHLALKRAGGGSIASLDEAGALHVGPESAGAEPGPVCYGQGGARPTVTDADLVLGYLDPVALLGGALPVDLGRARAAIEREIAKPLGLGVFEAAAGIVDVVSAGMAGALRIVSVERTSSAI